MELDGDPMGVAGREVAAARSSVCHAHVRYHPSCCQAACLFLPCLPALLQEGWCEESTERYIGREAGVVGGFPSFSVTNLPALEEGGGRDATVPDR